MTISTEKDTPLTPETEERVLTAIRRKRANLLWFPRLCVKTVCRRTGMCSADPNICMDALVHLVPEDARKGVDALFEGQLDRLSYDQVRAKAPFAVRAYEEWFVKTHERQSAPLEAPKQVPPALSTS
jgi:hypothetical protein